MIASNMRDGAISFYFIYSPSLVLFFLFYTLLCYLTLPLSCSIAYIIFCNLYYTYTPHKQVLFICIYRTFFHTLIWLICWKPIEMHIFIIRFYYLFTHSFRNAIFYLQLAEIRISWLDAFSIFSFDSFLMCNFHLNWFCNQILIG